MRSPLIFICLNVSDATGLPLLYLDNQGEWFRVEYWVEAEKVTPKYPGRYIINFKRPIGRVYHPDGTTTEEVSRAVVVRNADGTLKSAYPVTDSTVLK